MGVGDERGFLAVREFVARYVFKVRRRVAQEGGLTCRWKCWCGAERVRRGECRGETKLVGISKKAGQEDERGRGKNGLFPTLAESLRSMMMMWWR